MGCSDEELCKYSHTHVEVSNNEILYGHTHITEGMLVI